MTDMTHDVADLISRTLDDFFTEVDPDEADTDDMAYALVAAFGRAGLTIVKTEGT